MLSKSGYCGIATIFLLISIALYFAFAFPYSLFQIKQTETTEIKSVIVIARNGENSPKFESYFIGEEPPEELYEFGYDQLTNIGKERMYLLGKFLRMRYYHLLLNGNPRKLQVRSSDTDKCLESAQMLLAGLNPPKESWIWSTSNGEFENWQPKAIHTTAASYDDLLAEEPNCFAYGEEELNWKNSSKYQQLLNEFRHDLQTLRSNTGLEFEDDLEIVSDIEDSLRTRMGFKESTPAWYTTTFASRLAHIADVTSEDRFRSANMQRLYVGRLLHEIAETVNNQIRQHQQSLAITASIAGSTPNPKDADNQVVDQKQQQLSEQQLQLEQELQAQQNVGRVGASKNRPEANMFIYVTNKQKLSALMDSLKIYSSQPPFGALLLIEVHYDPINNLHFLRLFSVASPNPSVLPEPLRLNPIACVDAAECEPQQFEQNIRHLMLDKPSWDEACMNNLAPSSPVPPKLPLTPLINEITNFNSLTTSTTTEPPPEPEEVTTTTSTTTTTTSTTTTEIETTSTEKESLEKLDESLIVGPSSSTEGSSVEETSTVFIDLTTSRPIEETTKTSESIAVEVTTMLPQDSSGSDTSQTTPILPTSKQGQENSPPDSNVIMDRLPAEILFGNNNIDNNIL